MQGGLTQGSWTRATRLQDKDAPHGQSRGGGRERVLPASPHRSRPCCTWALGLSPQDQGRMGLLRPLWGCASFWAWGTGQAELAPPRPWKNSCRISRWLCWSFEPSVRPWSWPCRCVHSSEESLPHGFLAYTTETVST